MGISNVGSLIEFYPVSYDNWSIVVPLNLVDGNAVSRARVENEASVSVLKDGRKIYKIKCSDNGYELTVTFFNNKSAANLMKKGETFLLMGDFKRTVFGLEIVCPKFKNLKFPFCNFEPIYEQVNGLPSWKIGLAVREALKLLPNKIPETIPEFITSSYLIASLDFTLRKIHFPENEIELEKAKTRLAFEEILVWCLAVWQIKNKKTPGVIIGDFLEEFIEYLPFKLTKSQIESIIQCSKDMKSGTSMRRLLQGDVGSGKTAVSMAICYNTVRSGFQAAVMAPTEILVVQHYENFKKILKTKSKDNQFAPTVEIITGASTKKERLLIEEKFNSGEPGILIGTHALISSSVKFKNLALIITDEQHRFGVGQRLKLVRKGINAHTLIMSATPIPRSLAMVIYGDMDFSTLDEFPNGKRNVETIVIESEKRTRVLDFLKSELNKGGKGYIVCARVEEGEENSEEFERIAAENYEKKFLGEFKNKFNIGLLHGKMKSLDKESVIKEFHQGKINLLISTTVIEVGVDVPDASVMIIENAERFGLSALHQLRGRIGRDGKKAYCILISDKQFGFARDRLNAIKKSDDGFYLANKDLELRGPGEFFGKKQHGKLSHRFLEALRNKNIVEKCSAAAEEILKKYPDLESREFRFIKAKIKKFFDTA
jgi:ATP-dependent DNA helicase RecG